MAMREIIVSAVRICRVRQKRISVDLACWVIVDDEVVCYQVSDISSTGISLQSARPLPQGKIVEIQMYIPSSACPVSVTARVVRCEEGVLGLMFIEQNRREIERLLASLRAE